MRIPSIINGILLKIAKFLRPLANWAFGIGYITMTMSSLIGPVPFIGEHTTVFNILSVFLLGIAVFSWIWLEQNKKRIISFIALLAVSVTSYFCGNTTIPLKLCLLLYAMRYYTFTNCVKLDFWTKLTVLLIVVCCYLLGLTNGDVITRSDGTLRYGFGFTHPNTFALISSMLVIDRYYLDYKAKKRKILNIILAIIVALINFFFVDSRSALLLLIVMSIIYMAPQKLVLSIAKNRSMKKIFCNIFILYFFTILCLLLAFNFKWLFGYKINEAFSGRIYLYNMYLSNVNLSFFGIDISRALETTPLDGIYLSILIRYGIIIFITYAIITKKAIEKLLSEKQFFSAATLIAMLTYGIMESAAIIPAYNVFILLLGVGIDELTKSKNHSINTQSSKKLTTTKNKQSYGTN